MVAGSLSQVNYFEYFLVKFKHEIWLIQLIFEKNQQMDHVFWGVTGFHSFSWLVFKYRIWILSRFTSLQVYTIIFFVRHQMNHDGFTGLQFYHSFLNYFVFIHMDHDEVYRFTVLPQFSIFFVLPQIDHDGFTCLPFYHSFLYYFVLPQMDQDGFTSLHFCHCFLYFFVLSQIGHDKLQVYSFTTLFYIF